MKNLKFGLAVVATLFSVHCFATAYELKATNSISLSVDRPEISIYINYPGPNISKICGLSINSSKTGLDANRLAKELVVTLADGSAISPKENSLDYQVTDNVLRKNQYALGLEIRTKNHKNFSDLVKINSSSLNVVGLPCEKVSRKIKPLSEISPLPSAGMNLQH